MIEAKPSDNLEAYDLYLRAKQLIFGVETSPEIGAVEKPLIDAVAFLEKAVRLDPKFTLAYCACAEAHDLLYVFGMIRLRSVVPWPMRRSKAHCNSNQIFPRLTWPVHAIFTTVIATTIWRERSWLREPLRKDPRYEKLLTELAPRD